MAYQIKTKVNTDSVTDFLNQISDETKREDAFTIIKLMKKVTGKQPKMWGPSIVGFDQYHYQYDSGHEGDMCMLGFSPRAQALTLYVLHEMPDRESLLAKLGKHKTGKGCLYIKKLADVDTKVLEALIAAAYAWMLAKHR
jgi:hypothetical protein